MALRTSTMTRTDHGNQDSRGGRPETLSPVTPPPPARDAEDLGSPPPESSLRPSPGAAHHERVYLVGDKVLARGRGLRFPPWSIALVCPFCASVWGRIEAPESRLNHCGFKYSAHLAVCMAHVPTWRDSFYIPGSFFPPALWIYVTSEREDRCRAGELPDEVLAWEAERALEFFSLITPG